MQNPPPDNQEYPPTYETPYTPPAPPNVPPYTQPFPQGGPTGPGYSQPMPPYQQPYPQPYPQPYAYYPPHPQAQDNTTALVLEGVLSFFGIYGVGWLYRGRVGVGVALLVGGFVWVAVAIVIAIITFGIGALCFVPIHVAFIVGDILMLNNALRQPLPAAPPPPPRPL